MEMGIIWVIAYYLFIIWLAITIGLAIRRLIKNSSMKVQSRVELENLQKEELKKRIALLEKELVEKDKVLSEKNTDL
ncbi:hypothetical protein AB4G91_00695 [Macrococcoides goetzii]|uniref:hypothetical protein n=1 Tax=Macrococcus sp. PK TaxID=2801919 RepID=UPI001F116EA5|nr:hypothetical protein [Macrococcus sp. PK]MCH4983814.1 hypothetical protein [Macrococcus sp. PK]MCH4986037.1 hypothetical protein [Macrococcus sp. PK]